MIAHQRPRIDRRPGFLSQCSESSHKISSIRLVIDNPPLFNASNHHVVQGPWTIESCLPRHTFIPPDSLSVCQFVQLVNSVPFSLPLAKFLTGEKGKRQSDALGAVTLRKSYAALSHTRTRRCPAGKRVAATGNSGNGTLKPGASTAGIRSSGEALVSLPDGCGLVTDRLRVRDIRPWSHGEKRVTNCLQENSPAAKE